MYDRLDPIENQLSSITTSGGGLIRRVGAVELSGAGKRTSWTTTPPTLVPKRGSLQRAVMPPSTTMQAPTTESASSEARYAAIAAISSGETRRPWGWRAFIFSRASSGSS